MKMKNIIKILLLLSILLFVFACPKKESTKPNITYNNNIDVRFDGKWDLYSCNEENGTKYFYPVLLQKDYMVVSSDSLVINSEIIGNGENHGVFFVDGQIGYIDKADNNIYLYDYFYNKHLNRIWMKADTSQVANLSFDPIENPPDSSISPTDYYLLYPSTQPPAPILTSPENLSPVGELRPTLKWEVYENADNYTVQISKDSTFSDTLYNETVISNNYQVAQNLENFTTYYWRVKANNSVWSSVYNFNVFYIVSLSKPDNSASTSRKPTFRWEIYTGATNYTIQISLNSDFSTTIYDTTITEVNFIPPCILEPNKRYYWRVTANNSVNNAGEQFWSLKRSFITDDLILLQNPTNGETGVDITNIVFSWSDSLENSSVYHLQIADSLTNDNELVNIVVDVDNIQQSSYTLSNGLEYNKTYYWRVTSDVAAGWSNIYFFKTNNTVILKSPEDNSNSIPIIYKFEWEKLNETDSQYTIQISTNPDFSDPFEENTTETEYLVSNFLESSTDYYWRVKTESSPWSESWTFRTANISNTTSIISPSDGAVNQPQKPEFKWQPVASSSYYQLIISDTPEFISTILDTVIDASNYFFTPLNSLNFNQTYYWKVRSDLTLWSQPTYSFTVESGIPQNFIVYNTSPLKLDISWTSSEDISNSYLLQRWDNVSQEWSTIADQTILNKNTYHTYVDFNLDPNRFYKYRIKTISDAGESDYVVYPNNGEGIQPLNIGTINLPEMINVSAGTFTMGSTDDNADEDEQPVHNVTLTNDFMISKYEISISQFVEILNYALGKGYIKNKEGYDIDFYHESYYPYATNAIPINLIMVNSTPIYFDTDLHKFVFDNEDRDKPIYDITYFAAVLYCKSLNEIQNLSGFYSITSSTIMGDPYDGNGYRLPTEAEWEYVAKYNDNRIYPWGNSEPDKDHANYFGSGWGNEPLNIDACPAGVSQLGIYNLAGNVWEWCNDTFEEYTNEDQTNPIGGQSNTSNSTYKIIRGGSCEFGPSFLRNTNRAYCRANLLAGKVNSKIGFRIVKLP